MQLEFERKPSLLPVASREELDDLGEQLLLEYMPAVLESPTATDIKYLAEEGIIVDMKDELLYPNNLLGFVAFADIRFPLPEDRVMEVPEGTIVIDERLHGYEPRWRFTAAHELAHWILHRAYYTQVDYNFSFRKAGYSYIACRTELGRKNPKEAETDDEWAEWQADNLAASLLMPRKTFVKTAEEVLRKHGYEDLRLVSGVDIQRGFEVVRELANIYQVSLRSVRIRMRNFGMYVGDM
ncbi:MAG: ImmA/IrrE family metallo-endopeptidase [Blautia sp.]|nr:ImmA/IrrE family metallo-endopeptidase [Blautia sp.]